MQQVSPSSSSSSLSLLSLSSSSSCSNSSHSSTVCIWETLRKEAFLVAQREPLIAASLQFKVIVTLASGFGDSLARMLSLSLSSRSSSSTAEKETNASEFSSWHAILSDVFSDQAPYCCNSGSTIIDLIQSDLCAIRQRDPACKSILTAYLFFKGFKALAAHRAAHMLWNHGGRREIAELIQSKCSEVWCIDIHPAAVLGGGLVIDHGSGVVIGETSVVGRNCTIMHGVTLGSTGKAYPLLPPTVVDRIDVRECKNDVSTRRRRHPVVGDHVLIGCGASILGPIEVGNGAKVGAGTVVLKSVPEGETAVGHPARISVIAKSRL